MCGNFAAIDCSLVTSMWHTNLLVTKKRYMKKRIQVFILMAMVGYASFGQDLSVGPRIGLNMSSLTDNDIDNSKMKAGVNAGLFMVYSVKEHFGVRLDIIYSGEGGKFTTVDNAFEQTKTNYDIRLNYMRIPLQADLFFNKYGDAFRPKISLGIQYGLLLNAKVKYDNDVYGSGSDANAQGYNHADFGGIAGLGFNYKLKDAIWLNVDAQYYLGFTDVTQDESTSGDNRSVVISAGLAFGINKRKQ